MENGHTNAAFDGNQVEFTSKVEPTVEATSEENNLENKEQRQRDKDPLLYCKWICEKPRLCFGLALAGHLFFMVVTIALTAAGYEVIPIVFDRLPLDIRDNVDYLRFLAWSRKLEDDNDLVLAGAAGEAVNPERSQIQDVVALIYDIPGNEENIFTAPNLKNIEAVEDEFYNEEMYKNSYCFLGFSATCNKFQSILRYFDGSLKHISPIFDDPSFQNIPAVLNEAKNNIKTRSIFYSLVGKNTVINETYAFTSSLKSNMFIGYPLDGYANITDREEEQIENITSFLGDVFNLKAKVYYESGIGKMNFLYNSLNFFSIFVLEQVFRDFALAIGSFLFIALFICIHTRSLWITFFSVLSILICFMEANLIYNLIFDITYFGIYHIFAVFIILGIGADDIFVLYDTWRETEHHVYKSPAHRLSSAYRKAAAAMFYTSVTTATALFCSATAPFLAIFSFGVFAGTLVLVNYVSVIVFMPTVVMMYHIYFEKKKCLCCPCKTGNNTHDITAPPAPKKRSLIVRFFEGPYYKFVTHKVARWIILLVFLAVIVCMVYYASQLQVNEDAVEFMTEDTILGSFLKVSRERFAASLFRPSKFIIAWGLKEQSLAGCHIADPACFGTTQWDDEFNLNSEKAQREILGLCETIRNLPDEDIDRLYIGRSVIDNQPDIHCFMEEFRDFIEEKNDLNFPVIKADAVNIINNNSDIYTEDLSDAFLTDRHYEIAHSYWMNNGFDVGDLHRYTSSHLVDYTGEGRTGMTKLVYPAQLGGNKFEYGTRLRYAAIVVNSSIVTGSFGFPTGLPVRDAWEEFVNTELSKMSPELQGGFQVSSDDLWHWLKIQQVLVRVALTGIGIGLLVATPILIIATSNIITGLMATFTIILIVVSVIGTIPAYGWKLGFLEALNLVLVVGLSVDYVVHLAEGYSRSPHHDRLGRTQSMLKEVGISVLSGALTTLGSSVFLLPAKIIFFAQFGLFIFSTIGFSIAYALGFFTTCLALFGPEGNTGSLKPCFQKCSALCCNRE